VSTPVGSTAAMSRQCGQLTLFDCMAAGGSESTAKRQKIDTADAAGNAESNSSRATDNDQFETHLGVDPAGTDSSESESEQDHSGISEDRDVPGNRQDITINQPCGPTTIVLNAASHGSRVQSSEPVPSHSSQHLQAPSDIASGVLEAPKQPGVKFSSRSFGMGRQRSFNSDWYKSHPWLEYSVERDAAFCYPCRLFKSAGSSRSEDAFTKTGF